MPDIDPKDGDKGAAGGAPAAGAGAPPPEAKKLSLTQDELDAIIEARVARAKPKDYDDLVKLRDEREKAAEKEKTDLQREKDARIAAEAKTAETEARANLILRRSAIVEQATAQNAADAETVVALLAADDSITVEADKVKGAKQAVEKLLKDKPFLKAAGTPGASGGEFGGTDARTLNEQIREAEDKKDWTKARQLKTQAMFAGR